MRIAIVEDDEKDMENLRGVVDAYGGGRGMSIEIDTFSSGEDFMREFAPQKYGLVFFDNYIGKGLGIDFARAARAQDQEVEFVFVSMSPEFAVSGFDVRALHYLIKPATPEAIAKVFDRFWKHTPTPDNPMVEIMCDYHPILIPVRSIRYIEIVDKMCMIHGEKDIQTYMNLDKLLDLLPATEFTRTHRSFAVRLSYIRVMNQNDFVLDDGRTIPIGRSYLKHCKSAYIDYLANKRKSIST